MREPINDRELPEELMAAMMRLEEEAYRAGQHGCCEEGAAKMANPSCFGACETHGPRARAALSLLCHALAQWSEGIVEEAARFIEAKIGSYSVQTEPDGAGYTRVVDLVRALAPPCPRCDGWGEIPDQGYCDCSRGKAYAHWESLNRAANPESKET